MEHMLPNQVQQRIKNEYAAIRGDNAADWNPVKKTALLVTRVENQLVIDELLAVHPDEPGDNGPALQAAQSIHGHTEQLQAVLNQVHLLRQEVVDGHQRTQEGFTQVRAFIKLKFQVQQRNINRLRQAAHHTRTETATVTAAAAGGGGGGGIPAGVGGAHTAEPARNATLSRRPGTIHDLWQEYMFGIGGRVPAKDFQRREKGQCKYTYSKRNQVWSILARLVRAGVDADVACDRFYQAYGRNKSVSAIIDLIYADRRSGRGLHPILRVGDLGELNVLADGMLHLCSITIVTWLLVG